MKQPTKDALREQLALAADEIIRLKTLMISVADELDRYAMPPLMRLWLWLRERFA